jgi:hypothetical protein
MEPRRSPSRTGRLADGPIDAGRDSVQLRSRCKETLMTQLMNVGDAAAAAGVSAKMIATTSRSG